MSGDSFTLWRRAWSGGHRHPGTLLVGGAPREEKRRIAEEMAAWLLCPLHPADSCHTCTSCTQVARKTHPAFRWISPDGKWIKIDQIRALIDFMSLTAFGGGRKVAIIEEAQAMNPAAANAFLKTLEEPPPECAFFLIAPGVGMLPATIVSRLQRVIVRPGEGSGMRALGFDRLVQLYVNPLMARGSSRVGLLKETLAHAKDVEFQVSLLGGYEEFFRGAGGGRVSAALAAEARRAIDATRRLLTETTANPGLQLLALISRLVAIVEREAA